MEAVRFQTPLVDGPFGVPTSDGPVIACRTAFFPGLAFDRAGGRLGYGGGYYDRWAERFASVTTIGLGFDVQRVDQVPMQPHDRPLDDVWFLPTD